MSEDVARAVGAGGDEEFKVNGKPARIRPLTVKDLTEVQRCCVKSYRKQYLEGIYEGLEFLPDDVASSMMQEKVEETARWDVEDLPVKVVYDSSRVKVTNDLTEWIKSEFTLDEKLMKSEAALQRITASALDQENLSPEKYEELTGSKIKPHRVGYVNWWATASLDGLVEMVVHGVEPVDEPITKEDVIQEFTDQYASLVNVAREIESYTAPDLGNGSGSSETE